MSASRRTCPCRRSGQTLIEACLVIALTSLIFFGALQLSQILAARGILEHAAARGARAQTVGFNRGMVSRVIDVAAIPNAGRLRVPEYENVNPFLRGQIANERPGNFFMNIMRVLPSSDQARLELARIPEYLGAENAARARYVLDYEDWGTGEGQVRHWATETGGTSGDDDDTPMIHVHTEQNFRLWVPLHRTFYAADRIALAGDARLESHYPLYLEDQGW